MDLLPETDRYIKGMIEHSLDLPVPADTLCLKLISSEDARRRLKDRVFLLEDRLKDATMRLEQYKAEASMSAQGLRKCIEEKEAMLARCIELSNQSAKLERECLLYDQDMERLMESCDELGKENEELRARVKESENVISLVVEIESLKKDKEHLRVNLVRAEEEAKVLFEENNILDRENKWLLKQLNKERREGSDGKHCHKTPTGCVAGGQHLESASCSTKGKRKSFLKSFSNETALDFDTADSARHPLSHLQPNSPDSRRQKK